MSKQLLSDEMQQELVNTLQSHFYYFLQELRADIAYGLPKTEDMEKAIREGASDALKKVNKNA